MLKLTLDVLAKENEKLKQQATELDNNVKKNKLQLQDYLNSITNKDSAVESLNKKIEQLHIRLNELNKSKGHVSTNGNEKTSRKIKNEYKYSINKEHFYNFCQMQYQLMNEIDRIKLLINNCIIEKKNLEKNILICDNERINMNKLFDEESIAKINNVFDKETDNKTIYLIDKEKRTWKFSKREDLSIDDIINKSSLINSTPNVKIENSKSSLFLIGKEITKTVVYNEDIKTYNNNLELITDKSNQKDDYLVNDKTANENIIKLRIYDKWYETENGYSRKYKEYDLSSYGDKELTYYLEIIINTLSDTAKVHYQNKNTLNSEDLSNHIKYEISKIDLSNYETEYKDIDALIVILILAIFELSAEIFFAFGNKNFGAVSSWIYLFKNKSYIDNTEINELANLYETNVAYYKNRIKELFEENTELAKEYERLLKDENYQNMLEFINSYSSELELTKEMSKAKKRINTLLRK